MISANVAVGREVVQTHPELLVFRLLSLLNQAGQQWTPDKLRLVELCLQNSEKILLWRALDFFL